MKAVKGKAIKFGNNIDTDVILPGKWLSLIDPKELAKHAMEGLDPKFPKKAAKGIIVVGAKNFGCGSSREQAPLALKYAGVQCVLAESFRTHILPQQHQHRLTSHRSAKASPKP